MQDIPKINYNDLVLIRKLGNGSFGEVHLVELRNAVNPTPPKMAVKILKEVVSPETKRRFLKEIEMLKKAGNHKNVIKILGYCEDQRMCVVTEYVRMNINGEKIRGFDAYLRYLKNNGNIQIHNEQMQLFALQIAQGMEYLESKNIVHKNLAARNIMINSLKQLKISDFGLSKSGFWAHYGQLAFRWAAPEVITHRLFNSKSDVWSYGIVLWEIATLGETPYSQINDSAAIKLIEKGKAMEKPENATQELYDILKKCWTMSAHQRPSFRELVRHCNSLYSTQKLYFDFSKISNSAKSVPAYVNPFRKNWQPVSTASSNQNLFNSVPQALSFTGNFQKNIPKQTRKSTVTGILKSSKSPKTTSTTLQRNSSTVPANPALATGTILPLSLSQNGDLVLLLNVTQHQHPKSLAYFKKVSFSTSSNSSLSKNKLFCNGCCESIYFKIHHKCLICSNFHLCENCYSNNRIHPHSHSFRKITVGEKSTEVDAELNCGVCKDEIKGVSYKCAMCQNFDLCENCALKGYHP